VTSPIEADASGGAHRTTREHRRHNEEQHLEPTHRQAYGCRQCFAACEHIEMPADRESANRHDDQEHDEPWPALRTREIAEQPEDHAPQSLLVAKGEQQAHQRAAAGGNDDARKEQPRRRPGASALGEREHEQAGRERAEALPPRRRPVRAARA
jgi:hypothetical protein